MCLAVPVSEETGEVPTKTSFSQGEQALGIPEGLIEPVSNE